MDRDRSVARCVCRTPSDAQEAFGKGKEATRDDRGPHAGGVEAVRCVDHTRWRCGRPSLISSFPKAFALVGHRSPCMLTTPPMSLCPESTTIALLARLSGLMEPLQEFVKTKSVWGTCAGAILLARAVSNSKTGGQELLGAVSVKIERNGWGSQVRRLGSHPFLSAARRLSTRMAQCYRRLNHSRPRSRSAAASATPIYHSWGFLFAHP